MIQKVVRGIDSIKRLGELMEKLHIEKPLVVSRKQRLENIALEGVLFSDYHSNPDFDPCIDGAEIYRQNNCDGIIAIGGGSAIDTAKGIKAVLLSDDAEGAFEGKLSGNGKNVPFIGVPTTAGSGSEATKTAVVYKNGIKHSIVNDALLPDGVILDGRLLMSLPEEAKKAAAMDALAQGIESYISKSATEDSQVNAYLGVLGVLDSLRGYMKGEEDATQHMLEAAFDSGCAIRVSRTTAAHALSYPITVNLGIPHGIACMLTLPVLWDMMANDENAVPVMMDLASKMRLGSEYMVSRLLYGIMLELYPNNTLEVGEEIINKMADEVNLASLANNPTPLDVNQIRFVYRQSFRPLDDNRKQLCTDLWRYYGE